MRRIVLVLLLGACEGWLDEDTGPSWPGGLNDTADPQDTAEPDPGPCPTGMSETALVDVSMRILTYDAFEVQGVFDPRATYDGGAAACASDDRLRTRILVVARGEPYAWIHSSAPRLGQLNPSVDRSLSLDLIGAEPPETFGADDWVSGAWAVQQLTDGRIEHSIDAAARSDTHSATITAFITLTP